MSELGASAKALIGAAREGLAPDADAIARMRGGIARAIAAGGAVSAAAAGAHVAATSGTASAATATTATAATGSVAAIASTSLAVKLGVLAVLAIASVGTTVGVATRARDVVAVTPELGALRGIAEVEAVASGDGDGDRVHVVASVHDERPAGAPTSPPTPATTARPAPAPALVPTHAPAAARIPLATEVELIDRATAALRAGEPTTALGVLADYGRATAGHGQLAEDAAAVELEALCRADAPAETRATLAQRWPHVAQRARVREACDQPDQPTK